jgi:shikimate kinase
MRNLVLVGFMGTGKTTIGRAAARLLRFRFVDTDQWIERQEGRKVAAIFRTEGEESFRRKEEAAIATLSNESGLVLATGGGCLTRPANVEALKRSGLLVCLAAKPEVVLARTGSRRSRPLLAGAADPLARIRQLMDARSEVYAQADVTVDTSDLSAAEVASKVVDLWRSHLADPGG